MFKKLYKYLYFDLKINLLFGVNLLHVKDISNFSMLLGQKVILYNDTLTECTWETSNKTVVLEPLAKGVGVVIIPTLPGKSVLTVKEKGFCARTKKIRFTIYHSEATNLRIDVLSIVNK